MTRTQGKMNACGHEILDTTKLSLYSQKTVPRCVCVTRQAYYIKHDLGTPQQHREGSITVPAEMCQQDFRVAAAAV